MRRKKKRSAAGQERCTQGDANPPGTSLFKLPPEKRETAEIAATARCPLMKIPGATTLAREGGQSHQWWQRREFSVSLFMAVEEQTNCDTAGRHVAFGNGLRVKQGCD